MFKRCQGGYTEENGAGYDEFWDKLLGIDLSNRFGYYSSININSRRGRFLKTMQITQKSKEFFKEVWVEMKRVSWLSNKDVWRYTFIVLGITIGVSAFLGGLDFIFTEIIKKLIIR